MELVVIGIAAVLTAVLSAVAGLGGGIILLAVIAQFFPPVVAIPIQGGIQFFSNSSRAVLLRQQIAWSVVWRTALLMLPASFLGVAVATSIPENATRVVLGCFILVLVWRPSLLKWRGSEQLTERALYLVGALSGFLNSTVGASGPFTSPFLKAVTVSHKAFVATAAASQVFAHVAKIISFSIVDEFSLVEHVDVIATGAGGVIVGSWVGTRLLGRIPELSLDRVFKTVLTLLALRLVLRGLGVV